MSTIVEKDLLWDELGLDSLLTTGPGGSEVAFNPSSFLGGSPTVGIESSVPQFQPISQILSKNNESNELKPLANILQEQEYHELGMNKVMTKHKKMLDKPTYAAIMDRYGSLPHKPKVISKTKLSELADPVLGKLSRAERKELDRIQKLQEMEQRAYHYLPNQKQTTSSSSRNTEESEYQKLYEQLQLQQKQQESRSKHPYEQMFKQGSPTKKSNHQQFRPQPVTEYGNDEEDDEAESSYDGGGLFLTASNKSESKQKPSKNQLESSPMKQRQPFLSPQRHGDSSVSPHRESESVAAFLERLKASPHDKIDMNIKSSRNGFASMLRDRINFAQKVDKIAPSAGKKKKIDENDVISAYQRYANMKKEREKQLEVARKAARSKPPKIQPKMTKKANEVINKRVVGENLRKSTSSKNIPKKKAIPSSGYGKEVKRYSVHPKPPSYSKSKQSTSSALPSLSNKSKAKSSQSMMYDLTEEEELMMSNESLGENSDDEMMSNTFLTGMIKTNNNPKRRSLSDHEPSKAISKVKSRLRASVDQQQGLPSIPPSIPEKPASTSRLLGGKANQRKKVLSNKDSLPDIPNNNHEEDGVLVASASAPSSRTSLRQQMKASHRSNSTPSIAQIKQKAMKPESRLNQIKALLEDESVAEVVSKQNQQQAIPHRGQNPKFNNHQQELMRDIMDENSSLNAQNNYGKRRSANASSSSKLPSNKSGALQIPVMPRNTAINGNPVVSESSGAVDKHSSKTAPLGKVATVHDFDIDKELADVDAILQDMDTSSKKYQTVKPAEDVNNPIDNGDVENGQDDKEDIQSLISRLKKYENVQLKGTSDLYVKPDTNAHLVKHAEKIGGHFTNIDAMMEKINALKDGLE